jgi:hypothetical protein
MSEYQKLVLKLLCLIWRAAMPRKCISSYDSEQEFIKSVEERVK